MHIQATDGISTKGLYFTRHSNVLFNKNANYLNPVDVVKTSEQGFKYIENKAVSQKIKDRFMSIPFIKELAEKFDTFILYREVPKGQQNSMFSNSHFSFAEITWADLPKTEKRVITGNSAVSQECATDNMFRNLENKNFSNIA